MGRRQRARRARDAMSGAESATRERATRDTPTATGRYTPPLATYRIRPRYHKGIGIAQLVLGIAIVAANYIEYFETRILPGGHNEVYFIVGLLIAAGSLWWFGWLDRQPTPEEIRRASMRQRSGG